jgi:hypothetical protein
VPELILVSCMRPITFYATAVLLFASGIGAAKAVAPIRITAKHGSGAILMAEGVVGAFEISILPNGKTSISTFTHRRGHLKKATRNLSLTKTQLDRIARVVTDNRFFQLPSEMEGSAEDSPFYTLHIAMGTQQTQVQVQAPAFYPRKSLLRRFRRVWAAVSDAVGFTRDSDALHHLTVNS